MLGKMCPHCGRANAVGDSPTCVYCGRPIDGETEGGGFSSSPGHPEVTITAGDRVRSLLFSGPGLAAFLGLLFLLGLAGYYGMMVHFAPALQKKKPDEARAAVKEALEEVDKLLVEFARETGRFPETLSPDLAELEPYGSIDSILEAFQDGRLVQYNRMGGHGMETVRIEIVAYIPGKSKAAVILNRTHPARP